MGIENSKKQCCGKTAKGTMCSRGAFGDSIYCKTHIKKYEKTTIKDREIVNVIYHNHPPCKKSKEGCPRCELIKQTSASSSLEEKLSCLKLEVQT